MTNPERLRRIAAEAVSDGYIRALGGAAPTDPELARFEAKVAAATARATLTAPPPADRWLIHEEGGRYYPFRIHFGYFATDSGFDTFDEARAYIEQGGGVLL